MIIWIILFLLIIGISFILAYRSMKDYQEVPETKDKDYGLFLIRQTQSFNGSVLDSIGKLLLDGGLIISLERLFKGRQTALAIFGPRSILDKFTKDLNLLELEDYSLKLDSQDISIWEIGTRSAGKLDLDSPNNIFKHLSELEREDQFFWQVILGAKKQGENLSFQTQIRAVIYCKDSSRKKRLNPLFQDSRLGELTKIPRPFSTEQMMTSYHLRSLSKDSSGPILDSEGVMRLLKI